MKMLCVGVYFSSSNHRVTHCFLVKQKLNSDDMMNQRHSKASVFFPRLFLICRTSNRLRTPASLAASLHRPLESPPLVVLSTLLVYHPLGYPMPYIGCHVIKAPYIMVFLFPGFPHTSFIPYETVHAITFFLSKVGATLKNYTIYNYYYAFCRQDNLVAVYKCI